MRTTESATCVISGGGPAGMMLGLLLARAGVRVTVLEKHGDFLRDFRGDTVHASTIRLLDQLGLGEGFRELPQSKLGSVRFPLPDGSTVTFGDLGMLDPPYNYIAMVPQWDLLNFLAEAAAQEPVFELRMNTEVTDLLTEDGKVAGVRYRTRDGQEGEIRAELTVACDGRHSVLRRLAGFVPREYPVPFDTWWFRLPRFASEQGEIASVLPTFGEGQLLLALTREDFYQIAYLYKKGGDAELRAEGVESFRARVAKLAPRFADRLGEIGSMNDLHMLDVKLNRISTWHRDGLLCIGDAAHAMSPAGGVGINLAIQDAVAAARLLAGPLLAGRVTPADLAKVRGRRWMPTVVLQAVQRLLHRFVFAPVLRGETSGPPSLLLTLAQRVPGFRKLPARMVAFGPRPEHAPDFARR
ncbi:FAD-dependent oxidoreductase [Longispora albida]|uniref:FAD-dependent oxidoreductase n=1 Tax=Longispora albida TaxID=203523 RepID=UPI0012FBEF89|nr:FAD-dependent oxidoreductase [Longispora albida]